MDLTSDGDTIAILLSDIPFSGVFIAVGGIPLSATVCDIIAALVDSNGDFDFSDEFLLAATGECRLLNSLSELALDDLVILGETLGVDLRGECDDIFPINEVNQESDNLNVLSNMMMNKLEELDDLRIKTNEKRSNDNINGSIIFDMHEYLMLNRE